MGRIYMLRRVLYQNPEARTTTDSVVFRVMEIKESSREEVIAKLREDYTNSVWRKNIFSARNFEKWQMESHTETKMPE